MRMRLFFPFIVLLMPLFAWAQAVDYNNPAAYEIANIRVEGMKNSNPDAILSYTGLKKGDQVSVPGQEISDAIRKIWRQNIFANVSIEAEKIVGNQVWMVVRVEERPRMSSFNFSGVTKSQADDLREKISFMRGTIWSPEKERRAQRIIQNFFMEKGYYKTKANLVVQDDTTANNQLKVKIVVDKGPKIKINRVRMEGNQEFSDARLVRKMKELKEKKFWRVWARSKFQNQDLDKAKANLIAFYNKNGFRDAEVVFDTVYMYDDRSLDVEIRIIEGNPYYFRHITWSGNNKYSSDTLTRLLGIDPGDVYDPTMLERRLSGDPNGRDISSLYLDDGYLFFNVDPVENVVDGDSIDVELRMFEGPQATIRKVMVEGNTKTSDYVILRELRTLPGQKFSRADMIRSHREVLALGYFNQENLNIVPIPDPATGTVDLKYVVEEKPSDQLQVQGGWGGRIRNPQTGQIVAGGFVGTVSLAFNNFSTRRFFQRGAWNPVPSGDGQKLTLSIQTNGKIWQNYYISFLEPWLGGRKPNSLGVSVGYSVTNTPSTSFRMRQVTTAADFGTRLKFPDDLFRSYTTLSYRFYNLQNASSGYFGNIGFNNGNINIISVKQTFDRNSLDAPLYPRSGSQVNFSAEATPPYSLLQPGKDYSTMATDQKYKLLEYYKFKFNANWYFPIWKNLVIRPRLQFGFLGTYNKDYGISPFERFQMGGSGFGAFSFFGQEFIALRGYPDNQVGPRNEAGTIVGGSIYNKFTLELRHPITLNQAASIWAVGFLEAGNSWLGIRSYNPFELKRSAGVGLRVMVPMIGLIGVDWGYGFDPLVPNAKPAGSRFNFILGQEF